MCGVLVLSAGAVWTSPAEASQPPHPVYYSQGVTIPNDGITLNGPQQLAVNASDHTLLVANQGGGDVAVFSSSVDPGTGNTVMTPGATIGTGVLSAPYGLAVDQALHRLYVSDSGTNTIVRYTFTTGSPATYTADPTFTSPTAGTGSGQVGSFAASIAVDPTTHDLLVADQGNHRVSRYSAAGTFVRSFDGSAGPDGVFPGPINVAVGPGGVTYVADAAGAFPGPGQLERFAQDGSPLTDVAGLQVPSAVGVGPALGMVFVGSFDNRGTGTQFLSTMYGYIGDDPTQTIDGFGPLQLEAPGSIAVDDGVGGNLYFLAHNAFFGGGDLHVLAPDSVLAPGVSIAAPTAVTESSAHLAGTIDAGDAAATSSTSAHFEYYTTDSSTPTLLPDLAFPAAGPNAVPVDLAGLRPNTTYHVQLKAQRSDDPLLDPATNFTLPYARTASRVVTFTTTTSAPAVTEPLATDVGSTTASLPGTVDPFGLQGSYHFEYGSTDAYGLRSPAGVDAVIGALTSPRSVTAAVTGLSPGTTYHYRLVATNSTGTTFGPDRELTTDPVSTLEATRAYEQVTPVDKGGALMATEIGFGVQGDGSSADGPLVAFGTQGSMPGADVGTGINTAYVATRSPAGWSSQLADVPVTTQPANFKVGSVLNNFVLSQHPADLRHSVVFSDLALAPGAVTGLSNVYLEDNQTRGLRLLASLPRDAFNLLSDGQFPMYATPDSSHVYAYYNSEFYELAGGNLTLVSKTTTGDPLDLANFPLAPDGTLAYPTMGPISTPSGDAVAYASSTEGAFVNRGGQVTAISVSERPGDPSTPVPVAAVSFSQDGRSVFFLEQSSDPLTSDGGSEPGGSLYRYTLDAPAGHHLTYIGGVGNQGSTFTVVRITPDGQTVVYSSPDGLRAWRNGQRKLLSAGYGTGGGDTGGQPHPSLSPSGRYFAVVRGEALTSDPVFNSAGCTAIYPPRDGHCMAAYLFDLDANTVACVSCAADQSLPAGDAQVGQFTSGAVTDSGEMFFNTKTKLVTADVNAASDVYAYQAGRVQLISRGAVGTRSVLQGISEGGHDVFMLSNDQLVGQDTDNAIDLYDARIGGGIAAQNPARDETAPCSGTECHEPTGTGSTSAPAAASESVLTASAAGTQASARARVTLSKVLVGATSVRLLVHVSSRGGIRISGHYLTTLKRSVAAPGTYTVRVSLSHAAQRRHRAHHRLRVGVRVSLTPPFGAAAVSTLTRNLHG